MLVAYAIAPMHVVTGRIDDALGWLDRSARGGLAVAQALPTVELTLRATRARLRSGRPGG